MQTAEIICLRGLLKAIGYSLFEMLIVFSKNLYLVLN